MGALTKLFSVYYLNGLAAVGLVFLNFSFHRLFSPTDKSQAKFFLYLSLAWSFNLAYISFLDVFDRTHFGNSVIRYITVRTLNIASYFLFFLASRWKMGEGHSKVYNLYTMSGISVAAWLLTIFSAFTSTQNPLLSVPYVIVGITALVMVGVNYHIYFNTTRDQFGIPVKVALVYSLYAYALLQVGIFSLPPFTSAPISQFPHLEGIFFLIGALLKLIHIAGLTQLGTSVFSGYQVRLGLLDRAQLSIKLADQLAHELQTPAAELRMRLGSLDEATRGGGSGLIASKAIMNLLEQITGLLRVFERFQRDQRLDRQEDPAMANFNLNNICDSEIVSLKLTLQPTCRIEKDYDVGTVVYGVESEFSQIVRNIVKNAIESVANGVALGGRIGVVRVKTGNTRELKTVRLTVEDNGHGIDLDLKDHIFEDGISSKGNYGRGHGLSIVSDLVKKNDGKVWAENILQGSNTAGARFIVEFPLAIERRLKETRGADQ